MGNRTAREVTKRFTWSYCAWRRWKRALRCQVTSSLVGMTADMAAYDHLLRKHGKRVFDALHVKKERVSVRRVDQFSRYEAKRRGFCALSVMLQRGYLEKMRGREGARLRKRRVLAQWQSFVQYRITREEVETKSREAAKKLISLSKPSTSLIAFTPAVTTAAEAQAQRTDPASKSRMLGLLKHFHHWRALSSASVLCAECTLRAEGHLLRRSLLGAMSCWWRTSKWGSSAQKKGVRAAAGHLSVTKMRRCFVNWRVRADCQSEETRQDKGSNARFLTFQKLHGRRCIAENIPVKDHLTISRAKLDMASACTQHMRTCWGRVSRSWGYRGQLLCWSRSNDRDADGLHVNWRLKGALTAWTHRSQLIKQNRYSSHLSDMQYCISHMQTCVLKWKHFAGVSSREVHRSLERAATHHTLRAGEQLSLIHI